MPPRQRDIAMVFQNYALYAHMSVRRNMGFGLKMAGMPKDEIRRRVDDAAAMLSVTKLLERKPRQLSGGERQRVAMGRAIVREPAAFLMDEPLSNLDAKLRVEMRAEIVNVQRRLDTPTLYVTHDQVEAMTMGDRVAILRARRAPAARHARGAVRATRKRVRGHVHRLSGDEPVPRSARRINGETSVSIGGSDIPLSDARSAALPQAPRASRRRRSWSEFGLRISPRPSRAGRAGTASLTSTIARAESLGSELIVYFEPLDGSASGGEGLTTHELVAEATDQVAGGTPRLLTARLSRTASVRDAGPATARGRPRPAVFLRRQDRGRDRPLDHDRLDRRPKPPVGVWVKRARLRSAHRRRRERGGVG